MGSGVTWKDGGSWDGKMVGPGVTWKDGGSWGDMERWWVLG